MGVIVALLSAINVGARKAQSGDLKRICADLGWTRAETLLASGNLVADIGRRNAAKAARELEAAIAGSLGFESAVIVRDAEALDGVIARLPFSDFVPSRLLVHFMAAAPGAAGRAGLADFAAQKSTEPYVVDGAEMFIHYTDGVANGRLTTQVLKRQLGVAGTARNWNTVGKLRDRARALERS